MGAHGAGAVPDEGGFDDEGEDAAGGVLLPAGADGGSSVSGGVGCCWAGGVDPSVLKVSAGPWLATIMAAS